MSALTQLKLLISLSQIDGKVGERERSFIFNIGKANDVYAGEIDPFRFTDWQIEKRSDIIVPRYPPANPNLYACI